QQSVQIAQATYAQLGINLTIKLQDVGTFQDDANNGNFNFETGGISYRPDPDAWVYRGFHTGASNNIDAYTNPVVDDLLERARSSTDQAERVKLYRQFADAMNQDSPVIFY